MSDVEVQNTVVPARQPAPAETSPPAAVAPAQVAPAAAAPQPGVDADFAIVSAGTSPPAAVAPAPVVPAAAAPQPGVDADLAIVSAEQPQRLSNWTLSQPDMETIEAANVAGDVPVRLRNKVYAAIARAITQAKSEQIYMPPAVIARYDEAAANRGLLAARFPCLFSIYLIV